MKIREYTGKTTQDAIDAGLAELGVTIADVHVDVLQEGSKGLFGLFGSRPARVRITVMEDEKEDDQGLSDLLGSFSLQDTSVKKKSEKSAPKAEKLKAAKADKPVREEAATPAKAPEKSVPSPKPEKPSPMPEKPAPRPEKPAPDADKSARMQKAEKPVPPPQAPKPRPAEKQSPAAKAPAQTASAAQDEPPVQKGEDAASPKREYAPMIPAQPFTPSEPPVIHPQDTPAGRAQRFLTDVTSLMGVKVDVYVDDSSEESLSIHMVGDTLGILIGRRGETLDALQYLTSLQVNKGHEGYIRVTLDTENYRAKREESLRRLAQRMANRAQKTGRKVVLEPMNPYERRVLHTALQSSPYVTTHSEGEEPNRRVVITLKSAPPSAPQAQEKPAQEGEKSASRNRNHRRGRRGPKRNAAPQAEDAPGETAAQPLSPTEPERGAQTGDQA